VAVPYDSIAGETVTRSVVVYTYAPQDKRHYSGVDEKTHRRTEYLLSIPIPSVHRSAGSDLSEKSAGALQLLFSEPVLPGFDVSSGPMEFPINDFRKEAARSNQLKDIFMILPLVAFGMEVMKLRQTSYQVIHELKNKMIAGLSWVTYLKDDIGQESEEILQKDNIKDDFELSESSIREGAELAKSYLQFTKLYTPDFKDTDINDVLKETGQSVTALARELGMKDFNLITEFDDAIGTRKLDGGQLKMAFFNLCKNAAEVLAERKVEKPSIRITSSLSEGRIEILIKDNGGGMPPEIADNLFIPFKTKKEGGTGLGLTITKKIVDIHGGRIKCITSGSGTEFRITL